MIFKKTFVIFVWCCKLKCTFVDMTNYVFKGIFNLNPSNHVDSLLIFNCEVIKD